MNTTEFPEECLNNPEFANNMISTFCREIVKQEETIANGEKIISDIKKKITKSLETRKTIKQMLESEKKRKGALELTLQSSSRTQNQKTAELALVKEKFDEKSLKDMNDLEKYREMVKMYKETWLTRQAEYERIMPLASDRRQAKIDLQQLNIKSMILKQKKQESIVIQKQKWDIDKRRLHVGIVKLIETIEERWKRQKQLEKFIIDISKFKDEIKALKHSKQKLQKKKAEEDRTKLRARQLMPPPVFDLSFMSFSNSCSKINSPSPNIRCSIDSDNISINTIMYEEMCRSDDQQMEIIEEVIPPPKQPAKITEKPLQPRKKPTKDLSPPVFPEKPRLTPPEEIEVLEKTYRQLSIEKEPESSHPIEVQVMIEENPKKSCMKPARKLVDKTEAPEAKKPKLNEENEKTITEKQIPEEKPRELPKIQTVKTINKPVVVVPKPLVAEVSPVPSNLFSPMHYAPSCAGSEMSGAVFNNELEETPDSMNKWNNFSPQANAMGSEASFMSNVSGFKLTGFDEEPGTAFPNMGFFSMFPDTDQGESSKATKTSTNNFSFF